MSFVLELVVILDWEFPFKVRVCPKLSKISNGRYGNSNLDRWKQSQRGKRLNCMSYFDDVVFFIERE